MRHFMRIAKAPAGENRIRILLFSIKRSFVFAKSSNG